MKYALTGWVVPVVAGHAGKPTRADPGAVDPTGPGDLVATYEVEHTVALAELVATTLRALGAVAPVLTGGVGSTAAAAVSLGAQAVVSVHLNAGPPSARGFEVWALPVSPAPQLAELILAELARPPAALGFTYVDRGFKPAEGGTRARGFLAACAPVPAVLVEAAFVDGDEGLINSALFRHHVASAVAYGVAAYAAGRIPT